MTVTVAKFRPMDVRGWTREDEWSNPFSVWLNRELTPQEMDAYASWSEKAADVEPLGFCPGLEDGQTASADVPDEFYAFMIGGVGPRKSMGDVICYPVWLLLEDPALQPLADAAASRSGRMWAEAVRDYSDL